MMVHLYVIGIDLFEIQAIDKVRNEIIELMYGCEVCTLALLFIF